MIASILLPIAEKIKPILKKILPRRLRRYAGDQLIKMARRKKLIAKRKPFARMRYPDGINLIGYIRGEFGIGQSLRLLCSAIDHADIAYTIYNFEHADNVRFQDQTWAEKISNNAMYNINLIHLNPPELRQGKLKIDHKVWNYRYNIGFWLWELEEIPKSWEECFADVDEIWTPSEFISNSIRKKTKLPVRTMVYPILAPTEDAFDRGYFGLPEGIFLFLCLYDSNSVMERKNPMGVIAAFKKAFKPGDEHVGLIIKINNASPAEQDRLAAALSGYRYVFFISNIMSKIEVNSLIREVDVLVSLHRAEGFGLTLAEAMLLGTPVIATNWSANTEFMQEENACLVGYHLITLEKDYSVYQAGNRWAEPDLEEAKDFMVRLVEDETLYRQKAAAGQKAVMQQLSLNRASEMVTNRLCEIYQKQEVQR